jgi:ubiquinone biosynthesis accessory factor UbiJ
LPFTEVIKSSMVLKPLLMSALETALNRYLAMDQNSGVFLAPLAGKVIAVTILPFNETIYLCPAPDSIQLLDSIPDQPDTHLTGSVFALGLMGLSSKPMRSIFSGEVKIEGDMNAGRKFQELFAKLDINLEQQLARYTGDTIAHNISQFFRAGQNWSKESIETFRLNTTEFLQEETRDLPSEPEVDIFYSQVDELRTGYDRLQSRVERLERYFPHDRNN